MSRNLEVSFNSPQCGWMSIGFESGTSEFHTTTAHAPHESALPDLLRILTQLIDKNSERNTFLLKWNRDPEEFDFEFIRKADLVTLNIYQYPTDERASDLRELVFSHSGSAGELCSSFAATFEQLYADRDTDEFEFNWRQPFPFAEYEEFRNGLK